jgi:hypothetical protein
MFEPCKEIKGQRGISEARSLPGPAIVVALYVADT